MSALALRMTGADFLKLRRKHWLVWLSLFLTLGVIAIVFIYKVSAHASSSSNSPAGGIPRFTDNLRVLTLFFGPLAAILIGIEAGTGDASAGVFRDLVVTGRSRLGIFASRVPAALGLCWAVTIAAYALIAVGSIVFASGQATPGGALIVNGLLFSLFATGAICVIAVGFASLTTSRAGAIVTLIAWQLIASPLLSSISSLGGVRRAILSQAIAHFSPVSTEGRHGSTVSMSSGTAVLVAVLWMLLFVGLGAWRTRSMDA